MGKSALLFFRWEDKEISAACGSCASGHVFGFQMSISQAAYVDEIEAQQASVPGSLQCMTLRSRSKARKPLRIPSGFLDSGFSLNSRVRINPRLYRAGAVRCRF